MKTIILAVLLGIVTSGAHGSDVGIEALDYAKIKDLLPSGWIIKSVNVVDSPTAWRRSKGSKGIMVSLENPTVTVHDQMVGDYHPMYSFTLVPSDWEGKSMLGATFADGKIQKTERNTSEQVYPDRFRQAYPKYYYFESYLGRDKWKDPFMTLSKYFDEKKGTSNKAIDGD